MKIYLVRHGESSTSLSNDNKRPLSKKGRSDIKSLGKFISNFNIQVDYLYHSNKLRAVETAKLLLPSIDVKQPIQIREELDPVAPIELILHELYVLEKDIILVGHMPFMGKLVAKLVTGNENLEIVAFKAGTMICLEQHERERWVISWMHSPI